MTKQQAWQLAAKEFLNYRIFQRRDKAMETYAAAFAEWVDGKYFQTLREDETKVWIEVYSSECPIDLEPEYTTAELITEFEKIAP